MKNICPSRRRFGRGDVCLSGCGKKSETPFRKNPPRVIRCPSRRWWWIASRAFRGGRFVVAEVGDPKTFNYITANESSSIDICRFMFWGLLNFDVPTQDGRTGPGGIVDELAGRQNLDVQTAEKSALERRRAADGGRRGVHLERYHLQPEHRHRHARPVHR